MALTNLTDMSGITNAARITILQPIDANYKTGGGDVSVGGCLVVATKGRPFTPTPIYGNSNDLIDTFGMPLPKKTPGMEGLRHLADAAESCRYVNAARVVNIATYRFPSLTFLAYKETGNAWAGNTAYAAGDVVSYNDKKWLCMETHTSVASVTPSTDGQTNWVEFTGAAKTAAHVYNETITAGDGAAFVIYPIDGDDSVNRTVRFTNIDTENKQFTISIYDKDALGNTYRLESHTVGVDEDDKDDMALPSYIETIFENSDHFRVEYNSDYKWEDVVGMLQANADSSTVTKEFAFVGGTAGGYPEVSDWLVGVNAFANELVDCNLLFAAGCYEPDVIMAMAAIADDRHIAFFYDIPPALKCTEAISWDQSIGLTSRHSRAYYSPFSAADPWRGGTCVWGVSGAMAAAKARCNYIVSAGSTPGVHYSPAGEDRSYLTRTGIAPLFPEDVMNREKFYEARINPILPITSGSNGADDDLSHWFKDNYLRFGWVNDVLDYIDHRFYQAASQVKFEPDGLTQESLTDMTSQIMEDLVTSGALVPPRDGSGGSPYSITVEQLEIDLWKVTWNVCITGCARRIAGQPVLIR